MVKNKSLLLKVCRNLLTAYKEGKLGDISFPEEQHPIFTSQEEKLIYFTLPMSLNYRRESKYLWRSALQTIGDPETMFVFNFAEVTNNSTKRIQKALTKHKLALLPNKHTETWKRISETVLTNWVTLSNLFMQINNDFLKLRKLVQGDYKKEFPYLSGPKIFNYWSFILEKYGGIRLKNREEIEIAPDTHVIKGSVRLGVINQKQARRLDREKISKIWRDLLKDSGIDPIDMHPPLWFWSKNGFRFNPFG